METTTQQEAKKSAVLNEKKQEIADRPRYTEQEIDFLSGLQVRLEKARDQRDTNHEEFDNMTYLQWYDMNEKLANTYIPPKKSKGQTTFVSGTVRQKLFALLAHLNNLDLSPDISAFDDNNLRLQSIGNSMEDIFQKIDEENNDGELKMLRQFELLKQGTVFVEDQWEERYYYAKPTTGVFDGKLNSMTWVKRRKLLSSKPVRKIIPGVNVFLGSLTTYDSEDQPYLFTVEYIPYSKAESLYGSWERWKNVSKKVQPMAPGVGINAVSNIVNNANINSGTTASSLVMGNWRLLGQQTDMVEVIKYQDKPNFEYALILNGVLMTPVGMPFPWVFCEYSLKQQNLEPFNSSYAYGKSFCSKLRQGVEILDEMLRLAILKTQKSFNPPRINITGRVLSSDIFMPFAMTPGISPNSVRPIDDKDAEGVTSSEMAMIQQLMQNLDTNSVSPTFAGQQGRAQTTATEILEQQRQARNVLGITTFSISMLEWKLSWLRLFHILQKWFDPVDTQVDEMRGVLKEMYRSVNVQKPIGNEGIGQQITMVSKEVPSPQEIYDNEERLSTQYGQPIRITVLDPETMKNAKRTWQISIIAKEKKSSEASKLLFRGFMQDISFFGPTINLPALQEEFATTWEKDPNKLFKKEQTQMVEAQGVTMPNGQQQSSAVQPPSPERAMGEAMKAQMQQSA